jgi:energy-coupling factor transport system ATP-binding protein
MFLQFDQVNYRYPQQSVPAVHNLCLTIKSGEFIGILGANDSGKTTLVKLCNGLLMPSAGSILLEQKQIGTNIDIQSVRRMVGVVFADPENQIVGDTVEEEVAFGLGNLCVPPAEMRTRIDEVLDALKLRKYALREPHKLSGGEQQKLCLASVLAMQPECLVLDAPMTFLDSASRAEILTFLHKLHAAGQTMLYATTEPEELIGADRILLLHKGTCLDEEKTSVMLSQPGLLEQAGIQPSHLKLLEYLLTKRPV